MTNKEMDLTLFLLLENPNDNLKRTLGEIYANNNNSIEKIRVNKNNPNLIDVLVNENQDLEIDNSYVDENGYTIQPLVYQSYVRTQNPTLDYYKVYEINRETGAIVDVKNITTESSRAKNNNKFEIQEF